MAIELGDALARALIRLARCKTDEECRQVFIDFARHIGVDVSPAEVVETDGVTRHAVSKASHGA